MVLRGMRLPLWRQGRRHKTPRHERPYEREEAGLTTRINNFMKRLGNKKQLRQKPLLDWGYFKRFRYGWMRGEIKQLSHRRIQSRPHRVKRITPRVEFESPAPIQQDGEKSEPAWFRAHRWVLFHLACVLSGPMLKSVHSRR